MIKLNQDCIMILKQLGSLSSHEYANFINARSLATFKRKDTLKNSYRTLGVSEDCEDETLRLAFVHLAKRFHPDSKTSEADALRFTEIERAYREIQRVRSIQKEMDVKLGSEVEEFDIKHTAPQHRHYLNNDAGIGTPSQRQRQYTMERAQKAIDNITEHRLKKLQVTERNALVGQDKEKAKDIKTRYGFDRLVEDLIQEAMNRGEFRDLPGAGKPLKDNISAQNPYVDFVTHKMNQVLLDNGFTPEWIQLSKEIREEKRILQEKLTESRDRLGTVPLSADDSESWQNTVESLTDSAKKINNKINKYNLLVPILQKQMVQVRLDILAEEILAKAPVKRQEVPVKLSRKQRAAAYCDENNFLDELFSFFSKKLT